MSPPQSSKPLQHSSPPPDYICGDRVRHSRRPEWGIGTVAKVEDAVANGQRVYRLSIRFPNAGVKTLISNQAELEKVLGNHDPYMNGENATVESWDRVSEGGWLAPMAERKIKEQMTSLPSDLRDAFNSLTKRLTIMFSLYRFDRSGRGLMDWAVAQSGLDDPLSRFTRQDLEQFFDRWAYERDSYLGKLIQEARMEPAALQSALKNAPPAAAHAVRRITAQR